MLLHFLRKNIFTLDQNLSIKTELLAGITTFITMAYILFVNPQILAQAGMDANAVFVSTCLVGIVGSVLVGLLSNYPIALAPGMGINAFFVFDLVKNHGLSWQVGLGVGFVVGVIFLIISCTKLRSWIIASLPAYFSQSIAVGIGLLIALLGFSDSGLIKPGSGVLLQFAEPLTIQGVLFFVGFLLIALLDYFQIKFAILLGILLTTALGILCNASDFHGVFSLPPSIMPVFFQLDIKSALDWSLLPVILSYLLILLFDGTGTLIGLLQEPFFQLDPNKKARVGRALLADGIASVFSAFVGTSSGTPYIESASGIRAGGKTGVTAIVIALLFAAALFFSPLAKTIPAYATSSALLFVGVLMTKKITEIDFSDATQFIPGFMTILMIPLTFSVATGVGMGIISLVVMKVAARRAKELNILLIILAVIFIIYFVQKMA